MDVDDVEVARREKGIGWILRKLAGDRQTTAHPFTIPKPRRVPSKRCKGRLAQVHLDFVTDYSLILKPRLPCLHSRALQLVRLTYIKSICFTKNVVRFWRAATLEQSAAQSKLTRTCISSAIIPDDQDVATFFDFDALQQQFIGFKLGFDLSVASLRRFVAVLNHLGYRTLMERSFSYGSPPTLH